MTDIQTKITEAAQRIADNLGLDFVVKPQWSNTGTWYFQYGFDTFVAVNYNFQDSRADFVYTADNTEPVDCIGGSPVNGTRVVVNYIDGASIRSLLATLRAAATERKLNRTIGV